MTTDADGRAFAVLGAVLLELESPRGQLRRARALTMSKQAIDTESVREGLKDAQTVFETSGWQRAAT